MENQVENQIVLAPANFVNAIKSKFSAIVGGVPVTEKDMGLMFGYLACINNSLAENQISFSEIDQNALARDLAYKARLGLDMQLPNYLYFVPYRSKKNGIVTVSLQNGYKGEIYLAMKFAKETPVNIRAELVYETDNFSIVKSDADHKGDDYIFEITDPFNRGKIKGGFGYIEYENPAKNVLIVMSEADILRHKPPYATTQFWGEWKEEMYLKTVIKKICKRIVLDVDKYNEYRDIMEYEKTREVEYAQEMVEAEAREVVNAAPIDIPPAIEEKAPVNAPVPPVNQPKEAVPINNTPAPQTVVNGLADPDF